MPTTKNVGIREAIQKRDESALKAAVARAVKTYNQACPDEVSINTVFGDMPFSLVVDEDTKWNTITAAYVAVTQEVSNIPDGADKDVEIAKIVANNAILRNVGTVATSTSDIL